jgi:hypothetical protein
MKPEICPTCHQLIPPEGLQLPPIKARIYEAVRWCPGISAEVLRSIVWDGPDGGPENPKVLHVHVCQLNKRLAPLGVMVRAQGGEYRIRSRM